MTVEDPDNVTAGYPTQAGSEKAAFKNSHDF